MILQTFAIALLLGQSPVAAVSATRFTPLYGLEKGQESLSVAAFRIDTRLVTQGEFAEFVKRNPEWSAKRVSRALADPQYLKPLAAADHQRFTSAPMVWVSYFAAQAFCHDKRDPADPAVRGRLPTTLEWEVVAAADAKQD